MKAKLIQDPYRNPFHNRFHVPVHSRLDEMQTYTQMAWLNEQVTRDQQSQAVHKHWGRAIVGAFAILVVVVFSAALLSN